MSANLVNIIIGFILIILMNMVSIYFFLDFFIKLKKIRKIKTEDFYLNIRVLNFFLISFLLLLPILLLISVILFILSLTFFRTIGYIYIIFTCFYFLDCIFIFSLIIKLNLYQRSIFLLKFENKIVLIDEIIDISKIKEISNDLKRKSIFIRFLNDKNEQEFLKLKYNWKLKDWIYK
ncbi:hypothetical protein [Spiroplasma taiwanense]|uniref:Transmembrane protein n=1 Tax=Spiroplasma taiwanense CT-1 TaxID=1276220 RepID=S5LZM3_9MOLU|nr:hypothetical protein [Spiroplasma taiwanense]AGR41162.1 hypothetical protein STAIW_v1c05370 [Spiroplasma taiwanense CT-1]